MGDLSKIRTTQHLPVSIAVPSHWADHRFQQSAVLPAVEAMQLLAHWTREQCPEINVRRMGPARFEKFLELAPGSAQVQAYCDLSQLADGSIRATLATKMQAKSSRMTRTKIHAQIDFLPPGPQPDEPALDLAAALEGCCFKVDPQRIYAELVPFGPGYCNIHQPLLLTEQGALAHLLAPDWPDGQTALPLGSPFVLDAAMHAACVWSQRFSAIVAFPVGFEQRHILHPTCPGQAYIGRIFPKGKAQESLMFDLWILEPDGRLCEIVIGLRMRDVSGGRLRPPAWIQADVPLPAPLQRMDPHCAASVLIERDTLMPFADQCLTEQEFQRLAKMGSKRRIDYLSARLACKRLARKLSGHDHQTPPQRILTLDEEGIRPRCPVAGDRSYYCSVSHDRRFAVAVAAAQPIGVDVEHLSERILDTIHMFMNAAEQERMRTCGLKANEAAIRVWSIKEVVAKGLNIHLADAWQQTEVVQIKTEESRFQLADGRSCVAVHERIADHLFTLAVLAD